MGFWLFNKDKLQKYELGNGEWNNIFPVSSFSSRIPFKLKFYDYETIRRSILLNIENYLSSETEIGYIDAFLKEMYNWKDEFVELWTDHEFKKLDFNFSIPTAGSIYEPDYETEKDINIKNYKNLCFFLYREVSELLIETDKFDTDFGKTMLEIIVMGSFGVPDDNPYRMKFLKNSNEVNKNFILRFIWKLKNKSFLIYKPKNLRR